MRNRNRLIGFCGALLVAVFLTGVVELFLLRFEAGDVYPPYSSLRADPYGTRALYESLEKIPGATVARHMKPLAALEGTEGVVFYTGFHPGALRLAGVKQLEQFEAVIKRGARLIVALQPFKTPVGAKPEGSAVEQRWGVRLAYPDNPERQRGDAVAADVEESEDLPRETLFYFDRLDKNWQTLQSTAGKATVIA